MAEMNVWQGGIRIITAQEIANKNIPSDGQAKFDTCKHRSEKEVSRVRRTCCSSTTMIGWECIRREIFKLTPEICATCNIYEKRT